MIWVQTLKGGWCYSVVLSVFGAWEENPKELTWRSTAGWYLLSAGHSLCFWGLDKSWNWNG